MKQCPVCNASVFDDMDQCYGCLYQFDSKPETREPQKEIEPEEPEGPEDVAESEDAETLGETAGSGDAETAGKTAESGTTAKPREIQGFRGTEVIHKTKGPVLEIRRDAHDQAALTVRFELRLDFAPVQTALRDERRAPTPN